MRTLIQELRSSGSRIYVQLAEAMNWIINSIEELERKVYGLPRAFSSLEEVIDDIAPPRGSQGTEYVPVVIGFSVTWSYATNGAGQRVIRLEFSWTPPVSPSYGGAIIRMVRGGVDSAISGVVTGGYFVYELSEFPTSNETVKFYILSVSRSLQSNTYVSGITPEADVLLYPPPSEGGGQEYCQNVQNFSVTVTYPSTADGTAHAVVRATFNPPDDPKWGGGELVLWDGSTERYKQRGASSPITISMEVPSASQTFSARLHSVDVNGRRNSYQSGVTPETNIIVGSAAGMLDFRKFLTTSVGPSLGLLSGLFDLLNGAVVQDKIAANAVVASKIAAGQIMSYHITAGAVSSDKLDANEIRVGGGGGKPGKFGVYNSLGTQIGFIGVEGGYSGGWFKELRIGGTSTASAPFYADSSGFITFKAGSSQNAAIQVYDTSPSLVAWIGSSGSYHGVWGKNLWGGGTGPSDAYFRVENDKVTVRVVSSSSGIKVDMDPNDLYSPLRVKLLSDPTKETLISPTAVQVGDVGYSGVFPMARIARDSTSSSAGCSAPGNASASLSTENGKVTIHGSILDLARSFIVKIDRGSDPNNNVVSINNLGISVDGYDGITVNVGFKKPDDTTGTLKFRRGILYEVS